MEKLIKTKTISKREIVEYYGQIWDNVSHLDPYVDTLVALYHKEHNLKPFDGNSGWILPCDYIKVLGNQKNK